MAKPRSASVRLRDGVSDATLPDNRKMVANRDYAISLEDLGKLSRNVRESVITVEINTNPYIVPLWNGVDYALDLTTIHDKTSIANINADAQAIKDFVLGEVVEGFDGAVFKLVKLNGTAAVATTTTKNVGTWFDRALTEVSIDDADAAADGSDFAGVFIAATTDNNFGWIQIAGDFDAAATNAIVEAGDPVSVSTTTDGQFTSVGTNEVQTLTATTVTGNTFILTFRGQSTAALAQTATPAVVQAALEGLSEIGSGNVVVAQGVGTNLDTDTDTNTITFVNDLGNQNVDAITVAVSGTNVMGITTTTPGVAGTTAAVGTALTASAATLSDVALRGTLARNRNSRSRDIFRNARN